ncbi:MAG: RDD family protein [Hymenobacter sp.]|nr:MAG: RDD family protein [Hymenobacter sp.]
MSTIRVHTTQNVTLEYEVASVGDRILAALVDYLLYGAWALLIGLVGSQVGFSWIAIYLIWLPIVFYSLLCEIFLNGQTLGKKARHIRVMRLDGTPASLADYFLRWLLSPIEIVLTLGSVAIVAILVNGRGQRLGDLLAGSTVLSLRPRASELLAADVLVPDGYQPVFTQAIDLTDHDVALLRQLLSRSLRQSNYVLLNETATKIKQLLHLQSDLSDEAFLRTILRDHAHLVTVA